MSSEHDVRAVLARIDHAWRHRAFDGLDACFHEDAVIVGPKHAELARGRARCAASYAEFAANAEILEYEESGHALRLWQRTAVHTYAWHMLYQRAEGPSREHGTDLLVLEHDDDGRWVVVFRHIEFAPSP